MSGQLFTWGVLLTYSGAVIATGIIVQFLKSILDKITNIPTQVVAYFVALGCLLLGNYFTDKLTINTFALSFINAIIISTSSSGSFSAIKRFIGGSN